MAASKPNASTTDALQLLDELDVAGGNVGGKTPGTAPIEGDAAEALAFLDELTQKPAPGTLERKSSAAPIVRPSSRASLQAPTQRRSLESSRAAIAAARSGSPAPDRATTPGPSITPPQSQPQQPSSGGWGWNSVWSAATAARTAATAAVAQARTVVDEQVKHLPNIPVNIPNNEQARKWGEGMMEYVKQAQLDKITQDLRDRGMATFNEILNVVAPPISEHEVIQIWLSHDMEGYEGIENLVYRAFARILEQVEGGDLVVNKGTESRPKDSADGSRNLNTVDGQEAAIRLAKANIDELVKSKAADTEEAAPQSSLQNPTTYSHIYLRVQPFLTSHPFATSSESSDTQQLRHLHFLLHLTDPSHKLEHYTVSQAIPEKWLEKWDDSDWVEDLVAESLRVSVEVIGQDYVVERMGWAKSTKAATARADTNDNASDDEPVNIHVPL